MGCRLQLGNECHKGVPVGQGACCQIKSQHSSGPAGEIRPSSAIHAATQGDLLHLAARQRYTNLGRLRWRHQSNGDMPAHTRSLQPKQSKVLEAEI